MPLDVKTNKSLSQKSNSKQSNSARQKSLHKMTPKTPTVTVQPNIQIVTNKKSNRLHELHQTINRLLHSRDGFHDQRPTIIKEFLNATNQLKNVFA